MKPDTTNEVAPTPTTMTPQEINQRIAIACGWTWDDDNLFWISPDKSFGIADPPNYHGDLNAMHEAEKVLSRQQTDKYVTTLCLEVQPEPSLHNATASQRAEAFRRTIGQ